MEQSIRGAEIAPADISDDLANCEAFLVRPR
jgi:hypothetical protein